MKYPQWVIDKILDEVNLEDFDIYKCENCGKYFEGYDYSQSNRCPDCKYKYEWKNYDED